MDYVAQCMYFNMTTSVIRSIATDRIRPNSGGLFVFALADTSVLRETMPGDMLLTQNMRMACDDQRCTDNPSDRGGACRTTHKWRVGKRLQHVESVTA